jgi:hypothetical protein
MHGADRDWTLYFIHHSHTDIGYTHDQPIVLDLHERFISTALALAERYADSDSDGAFRWTVENTYVLSRWLQHATPAEVERFLAMEKAGRIEVTGMFANLTPLLDTDELVESFQLLRTLRNDYGLTITSAMNCDVNGENWPLVDLLHDLGIEGFTMAINTHFGGAPLNRPNVFHWQGPSGKSILAYNGWTYDTGWRYGLGRSHDDFEHVWWPRVLARMEEIDYPLPVVMAQSFHPFGDNGSAFAGFTRWIDEWNAGGKSPHIKFATPRQWWAAVKQHTGQLPTYRGDWTDYWNFGCASSAREQTINRYSRTRLRNADAIAGALQAAGLNDGDSWLDRSLKHYRQEAWHNLILWDEHTWGADASIRQPDGEDTAGQWNHKAHYAWQARSQSLLLQRDSLAALARNVERTGDGDILIANPLPWPRTVAADVPEAVLQPRGTADDSTAGRQFLDRQPSATAHPPTQTLDAESLRRKRTAVGPVTVPAFGYTVVRRSDLVDYVPAHALYEDNVIETPRYRLVFDCERGGVTSWYDRTLDHEWVDGDAGYSLNGFVHEEVADRDHPWPRYRQFFMAWDSPDVERPRGWKGGWRARRQTPQEVLSHNVIRTPLGVEVVQVLKVPGIAGPLLQSTFFPHHADYVEFRSQWRMGQDAHPEAIYLIFPFRLPGAEVRFDLGPQPVQPETDQLPGVCRDYFTTQNWVDFSNGQRGVTVATPENPMVQFGGFHFGDNQQNFQLERATLLGWVTNTYWETNFRAHQPGLVTARYRIRPYAGGFDESAAHRFGLEAAHDAPLLQHMGEPHGELSWPASGSLLALPEPPIVVTHVKPAADGSSVLVRLLNASDSAQTARIGSGLVQIGRGQRCDLLENVLADLPVAGSAVELALQPRELATVLIDSAAAHMSQA